MVTMDTLRSRRREILRLAKRHGASNLRVFGSVVRGEATEESDLDLLVEMEPGRTMLDLCALEADLEELLGQPVDFGTRLYPRIHERVMREAVAI